MILRSRSLAEKDFEAFARRSNGLSLLAWDVDRLGSLFFLIAARWALLLRQLALVFLAKLDVSIVQYSVSVMLDGAVPIGMSARMLLGQLFDSVRAARCMLGRGLEA